MERLRGALAAARNHAASAIVVTGDPGIGKTALLQAFLSDETVTAAPALRISGYSSEADLPYAAIDRLLLGLADEVDALPHRLRHALWIATGRATGPPPSRFQIGLALLSLFGALQSPTVVLIDDAQLLDDASLAVLTFAARRLRAETVLLLFATRPEERSLEMLSGIERIHLAGLAALPAVALLNAHRTAPLDPHVAIKVVEQLGGHPLAIIDLAEHADADRIALRALSIEPLPPGALLQGLYRGEVLAMPEPSQMLALLAVTDTTGEVPVVFDAARAQGIHPGAAQPLESAGLVTFAERVRFRHHLVRAAVYNGAGGPARALAHEALRDASEKRGFAAAATMHAATVAVSPDPATAFRLGALADQAGARGALLSRAALLVRAAELAPPGRDRHEFRLAAAESAVGAGAAVLAREQLDAVDPDVLDDLGRGRYLTSRALLAMFVGDSNGVPLAVRQLTDAAVAFGESDVDQRNTALIRAFSFALATEAATREISVAELGDRIGDASGSSEGFSATVLSAIHAHLRLPFAEAVPPITEAVAAAHRVDDESLFGIGLCVVPLALAVWDWQSAVRLSARLIDTATTHGALQTLDNIHWTLSTLHVQITDLTSAGLALENVRELRRAIGYPAEHVVNAAYLALTGVPLEFADAAAASILATGFAGAWTSAQSGIAVRLIADGEYGAACGRLRPLIRGPFPHTSRLALADFVEAAARSGHDAEARAAAEELGTVAAACDSDWLAGLAARSRALISASDDAEVHHLAAIEALERSRTPGDLARAHLLYGEWLRRQRRRRDARHHLAEATRLFDSLSAAPFADRARREFAATGESVPPAAAATDLTPQESLVAGLAREGRSNHEIAAALFISPSTVDYHLRKVFRKLGITSRRQLLDTPHDERF